MEKLFYTLINAWCWLRVAASPTLIGVGLGVAAWYFIGGVPGLMAGGALVLLGLYVGIRLATYAQQADQLVEFAHGMSPTKNTPASDAEEGQGSG